MLNVVLLSVLAPRRVQKIRIWSLHLETRHFYVFWLKWVVVLAVAVVVAVVVAVAVVVVFVVDDVIVVITLWWL